jgi:hypothetical protein
MEKIASTANLRSFLGQMLPKIEAGTLSVDKASAISKMAAQINESFYSEIKIMRVSFDMKKEVHVLGDLSIDSTTSP